MNRVLIFLIVFLMSLAKVQPASVPQVAYIPEIPDHCKNQTFCEDVANYPKDLAENLISKLEFREYDPFDEVDMAIAKGYDDTQKETYLCKSRPRVIYPLVAKNASGEWYYVLNRNRQNRPVQKLVVEVCDEEAIDRPCGNGLEVNFFPTYESRCEQKFFRRYMVGLDASGGPIEIVTDTPSCCDCIVKVKDSY